MRRFEPACFQYAERDAADNSRALPGGVSTFNSTTSPRRESMSILPNSTLV